MRGRLAHNVCARRAQEQLETTGWAVAVEKRFAAGVGFTDVDLWATRGVHALIVQVETSVRHALENLTRAADIPCAGYLMLGTTGGCRAVLRRALRRNRPTVAFPVAVVSLSTLLETATGLCSAKGTVGGRACAFVGEE
ncbi:MAG: hypothetical protein HY763_02015 [Planctomycetes bacterium]|nr:hypothetical protein [Planctomycetota bacterium]